MITYITTTAAPVQITDSIVLVTSASGITNPGINKTQRTNIFIDRECMEVEGNYVNGSLSVPVVRGANGTLREFHAMGQQIWVGAEIDFTAFTNEGLGLGTYFGSLGRTFETTNVAALTNTVALLESQLLGGEIVATPTAAANFTLPSALALLTALTAFVVPWIGMTFYFNILNISAGANTITLVAGTGVTLAPAAQTIVQNASARFKVVFTNVLQPAYTVYPA
jgi:hypothetical protein